VRNFSCQCGATVYFENTRCLNCAHAPGFDPARLQLLSPEKADGIHWHAGSGTLYRNCRNHLDHHVCNWLVDDDHTCCQACRLKPTIPDIVDKLASLKRWHAIESAKRCLHYSLFTLRLPVTGRDIDPEHGMSFRFLEDTPPPLNGEPATRQQVITGHSYSIITINLAEADPASREQMHEQLNESYRTLLGHFRHESGHYYWGPLVACSRWLAEFRELFWDERTDGRTGRERGHIACT